MKSFNMKYIVFAILLLPVFLIPSCQTDVDGHSVFRELINDSPEKDFGLNNNFSIIGMVDDNTNYYIAAKKSIWTRPMAQSSDNINWTAVASPAIPAGVEINTAFQKTATSLYLGTIDLLGTAALWTGSISTTDPAWIEVADPDLDGKQIINLFFVNSVLFVATINGTESDLYYLNGTDFVATGIHDITDPTTGIANCITSMAYDGSQYLAISKEKLFTGATADNFTASTTIPVVPPGYFAGVFYSTSSTYYITTNTGVIYYSTNLTEWSGNTPILISDKTVNFTQMAEINGNILVGTYNKGFFEIPGGDLSALERQKDEVVSGLYVSSILNFYISGNNVFFCTVSAGLYRNVYVDSTTGWGELIHE